MISAKIQLKTDTIENWTLNQNAILLNGEAAVVQFPGKVTKLKIGDGKTPFKDLPYSSGDEKLFKCNISEDGGKTFLLTDELLLINISEDEYNYLLQNERILSNAVYEVYSDYENLYDEQIKNLADPTDDQDAATKKYVDTEISKIDVSGQLVDYAIKNNISIDYDSDLKKIILDADGHKTEINTADFIKDGMVNSATYNHEAKKIVITFNTDAGKTPISVDVASLIDEFATSANVSSIIDCYGFTKTYVDGKKTDISAVHISEEEFNKLVEDENTISNVIYAVEYEDDNMYGERIRNVADPIEDQDAATKKYVDDRLINSGGGDDYVLTSVIPVDFEGGLCCQIENYKITTILISDPSKTLSVVLPGMTEDNKVRDFVIRFENTGNENASIAFVPQNDEDIDYESDTDDWAIVEPGINLISFTETKR